MSTQNLLEIFIETNALLNGHFLLTSGRHSNQYFQCAKVLQHPQHNELICSRIAEHFKDHEIDFVISPAIGGIVVGQEVARQLKKQSIFAEREDKIQFGVPQFSTLQLEVVSYQLDDCPLCKQNIPFVKPGSRKVNP